MYKYLLIILIFLTACKKEEPMQDKQINGVVVNTLTKMPVPAQKIELTIITEKIVKVNDPEWPNGKPVYSYANYQTVSDQNGQYQFNVKLSYQPWSYNVNVPTTINYIMSHKLLHIFPINERLLELQPDTVFVERPGYVRYSINTTGAVYENEALYLNTPYHSQTNKTGPIMRIDDYYNYNWVFFGKVGIAITDTIPAESNTYPEVEWLHIITDTIMYKKEKIHVQAGSTVNYSIQY
jgi:hypothetical protein